MIAMMNDTVTQPTRLSTMTTMIIITKSSVEEDAKRSSMFLLENRELSREQVTRLMFIARHHINKQAGFEPYPDPARGPRAHRTTYNNCVDSPQN